MSLSYINSLFLKNIGMPCPAEIETLLINVYIMPEKRFKKLNTLLNLSPSMKQIEGWTSESKGTTKPELTKIIKDELSDPSYPYPDIVSPMNEHLRGTNGKLLKEGLNCEYVNLKIFRYCLNSFKELKKDLIFGRYFHKDKKWIEIKVTDHPLYSEIKQTLNDKYTSDLEEGRIQLTGSLSKLKKKTEDIKSIQKDFSNLYTSYILIHSSLNAIKKVKLLMDDDPTIIKNTCDEYYVEILGKNGGYRSYSRHPIISNTSKMMLRGNMYLDNIAIGDMVKSFMVKDHYEYHFNQGSGIYYIQDEDGAIRRR